jgi:metallo-beta-lactamase class B
MSGNWYIKGLVLLLLWLSVQIGFCQMKADSLVYLKITETSWMCTAYTTIEGRYFPSNSLILKTDSGLVLIDTPVNDSLTNKLINWFSRETKQRFILVIVTHSHIDRIGGIMALQTARVPVICYEKTARLAVKSGYPSPDKIFIMADTILRVGNEQLELFFPGWGHTEDNIVVWIQNQKILYGGCFIKAYDSESLGNTKEADLPEWLIAARKVKDKFKQIEIIIPGHGDYGNGSLIDKTIQLLEK